MIPGGLQMLDKIAFGLRDVAQGLFEVTHIV
jgi:hypothetical protein